MTKELFPTLLNDKNLLFALKVRQLIEMINGTDSEIHSTSSSTSSSTFNRFSTNHHRNHATSPSTNHHSSLSTTIGHSTTSMVKSRLSSCSRSTSPYTSDVTSYHNGANHTSANQTSRIQQESSIGKTRLIHLVKCKQHRP
jgi:hypothetical protein